MSVTLTSDEIFVLKDLLSTEKNRLAHIYHVDPYSQSPMDKVTLLKDLIEKLDDSNDPDFS